MKTGYSLVLLEINKRVITEYTTLFVALSVFSERIPPPDLHIMQLTQRFQVVARYNDNHLQKTARIFTHAYTIKHRPRFS